MKRNIQLGVGVVFWGCVAIAVYANVTPQSSPSQPGRVSLAEYFAGPNESIESTDATGALRRSDPIFFQSPDGDWRQIGYVSRGHQTDGDGSIQLAWYDREVTSDQCRLTHYRNTGRLEEVVTTLLPPEKRREIQDRLAGAMAVHGEELSAAFVPLVQKTVQQSLPVIEDEFRRASQRHRGEIDQLAEKWNQEVVNERLIPLARREIMPIVRKHGEPVAEEIGRELWDRASLWRFGWRAVYDKTPLPQKNLVQGEWDRFVQREAIPVFEARMDEIVVAVQRVVTDVAANQAVRSELGDVADGLAADPETQNLVREILKETLVDNQRLRDVWADVWKSQEARRALNLAGDRLEPVVRGIGDDLFGTQESGINPNFARVLRNQILRKDRQWIVASISDTPDVSRIELSRAPMPYPIVYLADESGESKGGRP